MDYNVKISDMTLGQKFEGFYLLYEAFPKTTATGKPFLSAGLSDCTGGLPAMVWDYAGPISGADAGKVVKVRGEVSEYKGSLQVTVEKIRLADENDRYDVAALVPTAPIDADAALQEVRDLVASIEDRDYRLIAETLLDRNLEAFKTIPAAKSVHHAFLHGLLMHTSNMLKTADFLASLYGEVINRSLMLTGTLLHDFMKREEFGFSELGLVTEYTVKGQLLGHLVMGAQEVAAVAAELCIPEEKSVLLQHMVLSHHGTL
jgi:3'-5' exoribonuclease